MNHHMLKIDCKRYISPNFNSRHFDSMGGGAISLLVLHYTAMETRAALEHLCRTRSGVSAHYVITKAGKIYQLVDENKRAWHGGESFWRGIKDVNTHSIGIELDYHPGEDHFYEPASRLPAYSAPMMDALHALAQDIVARHKIAPQNIVAHSDIAPQRKQDPGAAFDWQWLATKGIGVARPILSEDLPLPPPLEQGTKGEQTRRLQSQLAAYGYEITIDGDFGRKTHNVICAFQRHFRPARIDGIGDDETQRLIDALARLYPQINK